MLKKFEIKDILVGFMLLLDTINNSWIGAADPDWEGTVTIYE